MISQLGYLLQKQNLYQVAMEPGHFLKKTSDSRQDLFGFECY